MIFWFWKVGIVFGKYYPDSFARGCQYFEGPYLLWFTRVFGPIYWAETPPYKFYGKWYV